MSAFVKDLDYYGRDYDIVGNYKKSMSMALHLGTGDDLEKTTGYVDEKMLTDWRPKSPDLHSLMRAPRGDRTKRKVDLLSYLDWVIAKNHILAPNLIAYCNPDVEDSFLSGFISNNLSMRKAVKKEGQSAFMDGNHEHATFCNLLQANFKIRNNSISGALSSPYNPLYYASSHTSLTSVCRAITSYANACNEKFMASNRHYFSPEVTMENMVYVTSQADLVKVEEAVMLFDITPPSVEYVYEQILSSSRLYWKDEHAETLIHRMVENMTPIERAAFSFIGDLNALHETNDKAIRQLYDILCRRPTPLTDPEEQKKYAGGASDDDVALASLLSADFMAGKKAKDLTPDEYAIWTGYIKQVVETFDQYQVFIDAFISTKIMPGSIHSLPTIKRRVVVGSDTDSSIFSTQRQVKWFTGKIDFSHRAVQAGAITSYLTSQLIVHTLALMSGQMGVHKDQLFRLSMKSEFYSKAQVNTTVTKHYIMDISACEGNVYPESELEVKGVQLKSSKLPSPVRRETEKFYWYLLNAPSIEGGISPMEPAAYLAKLEHRILGRLRDGDATYFKTEQIKTPQTYAAEDRATQIVCKDLWNIVLGSKYGRVEQTPADALKVNVTLGKEKDFNEWAESLDGNVTSELKEFMYSRDKKAMTQLLAPVDQLQGGKIPKEIIAVMDERKILMSLMQPFYLACNGIYMNIANTKFTHFFSDDISEEEADRWLEDSTLSVDI
ncbi:hypothetical protein [Vibrio phage vB_VmeM-Yong XC32]|nr:hypothetical protein [Vibrio phage vB_VmeM-Yong XC31]QAX96382.1 hypothetical protein [Vibrio phage vB_VmeM-Yong XC32]QAX96700.1 hypothetical protein [Vibrio phage vB_VmeM-Yong MS31]QAX97018.1 hypothetical protein [Vibrio phage vB_VmeM-Yong MS32]